MAYDRPMCFSIKVSNVNRYLLDTQNSLRHLGKKAEQLKIALIIKEISKQSVKDFSEFCKTS